MLKVEGTSLFTAKDIARALADDPEEAASVLCEFARRVGSESDQIAEALSDQVRGGVFTAADLKALAGLIMSACR